MSPRRAPPPEGARPLPQACLSLPRANVFTRQPHAHVCCSLFMLEILTFMNTHSSYALQAGSCTESSCSAPRGQWLGGVGAVTVPLHEDVDAAPGVQCFWPHCVVLV